MAEVHAFVRYDPSQMQFVKSCQVQLGLVNKGEWHAFHGPLGQSAAGKS